MANGQYDGPTKDVQAGSGYGLNQISGPRPREHNQVQDNWEHRSAGLRCHTCMFFVVKSAEPQPLPPQGAIGRCRRHAPTLGGYPAVYEMDWCGDHKVR